jgi:hypothetical protein
MKHDDRRSSPRVEMMGRMQGRTVALGLSVHVREISLGGMSVETAEPFELNSVHQFNLTLGDGATIRLTGRVLRTARVATEGHLVHFVSGIQFIDDENDVAGIIQKANTDK